MDLTPPMLPHDLAAEEVGEVKEEVRRENLEWRYKLLRACRNDPDIQALVKEKFHRDWMFAINGFFWTYERVHGKENVFKHSPTVLWPVQIRHTEMLVQSIDAGHDVLTDKSRDMGATWDHIQLYVWYWLKPEPGNDFLLGSRKEDYVDFKRSMGTLFGKARYAIKRLPKFLAPRGFKWRLHSSRLYLENPHSGSTITGESCNADFGSGDRRKAVLLDEFAKWERGLDRQAWSAVGDVARARHALSTPKGVGNEFERLRFSGQIKHFEMPWWEHPDKAGGRYIQSVPLYDDKGQLKSHKEKIRAPWYDVEVQRRSPHEVAQEIDISYLTTGSPAFDREILKALMDALRVDPVESVFKGGIVLKREVSAEEEIIELTPILTPSEFGPLTIWEEPHEYDEYILGVDSSEGKEDGDFCYIPVINRRTRNLAAEFHGLFKEHELATAAVALGLYYKTSSGQAWIVPEANSMGRAVIQYMVETLQYARLYRRRITSTVTRKWTLEWGWKTSTQTWGLVRAAINNHLDFSGGRIPSIELLEELYYSEVRPSGKIQGASGHNDDRMAGFGIALAGHAQLPYGWNIEADLMSKEEREEKERERVKHQDPDVVFMDEYRNRILEDASRVPIFGGSADRGNVPI